VVGRRQQQSTRTQQLTRLVHRHGKQGILNTASKGQLENEFGTSNEDDVVKKILKEGSVQSSEVSTALQFFSGLPFLPHFHYTM